jgi:DNA-binding transcriptional MerR regulator
MVTASGTRDGLTVAGLATRVGVGRDTIRYYERVGLLPPPPRTTGDHRRYAPDAVDRLQFIQGCQRLGLRLDDIRNLLEVRDTGQCACTPAGDLLTARLSELDAEVARLQALRTDLTAMLTAIASDQCPDPVPGTWCSPKGGEVMALDVLSCTCEEGCTCDASCCSEGCC